MLLILVVCQLVLYFNIKKIKNKRKIYYLIVVTLGVTMTSMEVKQAESLLAPPLFFTYGSTFHPLYFVILSQLRPIQFLFNLFISQYILLFIFLCTFCGYSEYLEYLFKPYSKVLLSQSEAYVISLFSLLCKSGQLVGPIWSLFILFIPYVISLVKSLCIQLYQFGQVMGRCIIILVLYSFYMSYNMFCFLCIFFYVRLFYLVVSIYLEFIYLELIFIPMYLVRDLFILSIGLFVFLNLEYLQLFSSIIDFVKFSKIVDIIFIFI